MIKRYLGLSRAKNVFNYLKTHKRISLFFAIFIFFLIFLLLPKNKAQVLTQKVERKTLVKTVSATGDVYAQNTADLNFQSSERLAWIGVKEGDTVKVGQAIATLDQSKLDATYRQAQQDFVAAKAASDKYYDSHQNATESYDEKVTRTSLDAAQNKAYDAMVKAQYDIYHSTLYSPIDGIVTRVDAKDAGVNVTPADIFTITDPASLQFRMEVDEADIGQVQPGENVTLSLDSFPDKTINITVDRVDYVSHKTSSGGNAFYVYSSLKYPLQYRVGMSGNADIDIDSAPLALVIPSTSIIDEEYIYVKNGPDFEKRKIKKGLETDIETQAISGVKEGELVAIDPNSIPQNLVKK